MMEWAAFVLVCTGLLLWDTLPIEPEPTQGFRYWRPRIPEMPENEVRVYKYYVHQAN